MYLKWRYFENIIRKISYIHTSSTENNGETLKYKILCKHV